MSINLRGHSRPSGIFSVTTRPNYTYAPNGRKLLSELAVLAPDPAYVRVHNLLTTGDARLPEVGIDQCLHDDAAGNPVYSWVILDRIFDAFEGAESAIGGNWFHAASFGRAPEPYRHNFPQGEIFTGWAYPPRISEVVGSRISICQASARALR